MTRSSLLSLPLSAVTGEGPYLTSYPPNTSGTASGSRTDGE